MGLYIPYRGALMEPGHDVANKRITTIYSNGSLERSYSALEPKTLRLVPHASPG